MAICPFARWRPLPENWSQPGRSGRLVIFHEAVSRAQTLFDYFARGDIYVESHFYLDEHGGLDQYIDTDRTADANVSANPRGISIETWDNGGDIHGVWNDAQLATLKRLSAWLHEVHGVPAQVPPGPYADGYGWHNLFWREWAGAYRDCPGPNRAAQVRNTIIPFVARGGGWRAGSEENDEMSAEGEREILEILRNFDTWMFKGGGDTLRAVTGEKVEGLDPTSIVATHYDGYRALAAVWEQTGLSIGQALAKLVARPDVRIGAAEAQLIARELAQAGLPGQFLDALHGRLAA